MCNDFQVGNFYQQEESIKMFDIFLWFSDDFGVKILDGFELLVAVHGEKFLFFNHTIRVLDVVLLLGWVLLFVLSLSFFIPLVEFVFGERLGLGFGFVSGALFGCVVCFSH